MLICVVGFNEFEINDLVFFSLFRFSPLFFKFSVTIHTFLSSPFHNRISKPARPQLPFTSYIGC